MKSKLKIVAWISGTLIACLAIVFVLSNYDSLAIGFDLHLGLSPCVVAESPSSVETVRVAVASLSDAVKRDLKARYPWHGVTSGFWGDKVPWYDDLVGSTEFAPVLRHVRDPERIGSNAGKLEVDFKMSNWTYHLVLDDDRNILWIVRDTQRICSQVP